MQQKKKYGFELSAGSREIPVKSSCCSKPHTVIVAKLILLNYFARNFIRIIRSRKSYDKKLEKFVNDVGRDFGNGAIIVEYNFIAYLQILYLGYFFFFFFVMLFFDENTL